MEKENTDSIKLIIDNDVLNQYEAFYFTIHKKASKKPIAHPYHESINTWMIMKRPMMNALKQKWKDFIVWFVRAQGYANLRIEKCKCYNQDGADDTVGGTLRIKPICKI